MRAEWEKRGLILEPQKDVWWLASCAGACFARTAAQENIVEIYVSGRDVKGRSHIGVVLFDLCEEKVTHIAPDPVLPLGEKGSFDENGTSYPYLASYQDTDYLYYTGWIQGVQVRWYNDLGLAVRKNGGEFRRLSRAPLPLRNDRDFIGIGSSCVLRHNERWLMWYTRFERWGGDLATDHEHYYNIKFASSEDGLAWRPHADVCIDFADAAEYALAKPCVLLIEGRFVMWYSYRGMSYLPGLAVSEDGVHWRRHDKRVGIAPSAQGWDSAMLCYPFILERNEDFFMFYNGNGYGASGLGFARISRRMLLRLLYD